MRLPWKYFKKDVKESLISYFSTGLEQTGSVRFSGTLRIDGAFTGEIYEKDTPDTLIIGKYGCVSAKVSVSFLFLEGHLQGDVEVKEKAHIASTATFKGSLKTPIMKIEEGATVEGQINWGRSEERNESRTSESVVQQVS